MDDWKKLKKDANKSWKSIIAKLDEVGIKSSSEKGGAIYSRNDGASSASNQWQPQATSSSPRYENVKPPRPPPPVIRKANSQYRPPLPPKPKPVQALPNHNNHGRISLPFLEWTKSSNVPSRPQSLQPSATTSLGNMNIPEAPRDATSFAPNTFSQCLECKDFDTVDTHAAKFPRQHVSSIKCLAHDLTSIFPLKVDKARAIFIWLHHNIAYDTAAFFGNNVKHKSPESTLQTGWAVCQGYAELFAAIGKYSDLEVKVVSGHGKGYGYREPINGMVPSFASGHAWNAVRLDSGNWHLIDACWGAGYVGKTNSFEKRLSTQHFTSPPEVFRLKHFPKDPKYQCCQNTLSWQQYILQDSGPLLYTIFHDSFDSTIQPSTKCIPVAQLTTFILKTRCQHKGIPQKDQYVLLLDLGQNNHIPFQVNSSGTIWTCEALTVKSGTKVNVYCLDTINGINAKGVGVEGYTSRRGNISYSFQSLCQWEVK